MGLWTETHFYTIVPAFIVFFIIAALLRLWLGGKSERVRRIPLQIITVIILLLEVGKQIKSFSADGYNLYSLPFHYCSLFLYLLPLHSFYTGKYRKYTDTAALGTLASLFLFMIIVPTVIYNEENILGFFRDFGNFHTVAFHNLVSLYFLITVALRLYDFEPKRDMRVLAVFLAVYVAVATVLSFIFRQNFHNLLECNFAPIESIRLMMVEKIGWAGHAIYIIILFFLTILFSYAAYFLTKLAVSLIEKRKKKA